MCQAYRRQYGFDAISAMPTNLYGPGDNYHPENSHVLPALIRRFHEAKVKGAECVTIWGTGTPMREFLHVDDMAEACVFLLKNTSAAEHINVVCGEDIGIMAAARLVARSCATPRESKQTRKRATAPPQVAGLQQDLRHGLEAAHRP